MKKAGLALLVLLLTSGWVRAQEKAAEKPVAPSAIPAKALVVFGKVMNDGRTLLTDLDSEWIVSNAEILKGMEGRLVRVKCYVDTERNRLEILTVKRESDPTYAARQTGSAFRR